MPDPNLSGLGGNPQALSKIFQSLQHTQQEDYNSTPSVRVASGSKQRLDVLLNTMGYQCVAENGFAICEDLGIIFKYGEPNIVGSLPRPNKHCRMVEIKQTIDMKDLQKILNTILVYNTNWACPVPIRKPDSVGFDLYCAEDKTIQPKEMVDIATGVYCSFPVDVWGLLVSRSSTFKKKITANTAIIDPGYQGELFICCYNWGDEPFEVKKSDRLAQLIPVKDVPFINVQEVKTKNEFPTTQRGDKGFGSTGK